MTTKIMLATLLLAGCNAFSHTNVPLSADVTPNPDQRATFDVRDQRGNENVLVLLAISGGGSRAAYFATELMFQFEDVGGINLMHEVDVISSVSGGSIAGAYYCITADDKPCLVLPTPLPNPLPTPLHGRLASRLRYDEERHALIARAALDEQDIRELRKLLVKQPGDEAAWTPVPLDTQLMQFQRQSRPAYSGRSWNRDSVRELMSKNYQARWIGNWFWPWNFAKYWFTAYDRADIMAKTFTDNMYDTPLLGIDLDMGDLNPERPYLIINATDATQHTPQKKVGDQTKFRELHFGEIFTFTDEDFTEKLGSDIDVYSVGRAVMASACFPSAFAYMTLQDYRLDEPRYVHVFDGGNADNLGLNSLARLIVQLEDGPQELRPDHYVVISIDAFTDPQGVDRDVADPRGFWDYLVDTNFLGAVDALLQLNRNHMINQFANKELAVENAYVVTEQKMESGEIVYDYQLQEPETRRVENLTFWHIRFRDLGRKALLRDLNDISTSLSLSDKNAVKIQKAAARLVDRDATHLDEVLQVLGYPPRE